MEPYSVGLDVPSRQSVVVNQDAAGHLVAHGAVLTTRAALAAWRAQHQLPVGTPVALETGTVAFFVARPRAALALRPIVVDAPEVRRKAYRPTQNSDRRDATGRCEGVRRGIERAIVHVPDAAVVRLRAILARRRHVVRLPTAQVAAVEASFVMRPWAAVGVSAPRSAGPVCMGDRTPLSRTLRFPAGFPLAPSVRSGHPADASFATSATSVGTVGSLGMRHTTEASRRRRKWHAGQLGIALR